MAGQPDLKRSTIWLRFLNLEVKEWLISPFPAAIVAALALGWVIAWLNRPDSYKIYVVSPTPVPGDVQSDSAQKFWDGFDSKKEHLSRFRDVPLEVLQAHEDGGQDGASPNAQSISSTLAAKNDTLLVVLVLASSRTKEVLPDYLQTANPPIPTVLTWQTNPNLLPPKLKDTYYPVLQMWPTDEKQAESAADFPNDFPRTEHSAPPAFWVVEDTNNPTYSQFLASHFIEKAENDEVILRSNNLSLPSVQTIDDLGINWVFFAGGWSDALILARQLKAITRQLKAKSPKYKCPRLILSEASVDDRLTIRGKGDVEGVYLTYPMPASEYKPSDPGLTQLGHDAFEIVDHLIEGADSRSEDFAEPLGGPLYRLRRALGIRRAADARNALIAYMQSHHEYPLPDNRRCTFDQEGKRSDGRYYVWKVRNGQFTDADETQTEQSFPKHIAERRMGRGTIAPIGPKAAPVKLRMIAEEIKTR
jgi:branched-chain amino acid transport system substrate-binding protein